MNLANVDSSQTDPKGKEGNKVQNKVGSWLKRWGWISVVLAAPFLIFPSLKLSPVLLVIPGLWIFSLAFRESVVARSPFNLSLLFLGLALLVSSLVTPDMAASLPKIAGMVLGLGTYFIVLQQSGRKFGWWASLFIFLLLGSGVAVVGLLGTSWVTFKFQALSSLLAKLPGTLLHLPGASDGLQPNEVAGALVWVLPPTTCLAVFSLYEGLTRKSFPFGVLITALLVLATMLAGGVLVLTQSRSAWLALALSFALISLLILPRRAAVALLGVYMLVTAGLGYGLASGRIASPLSGGISDSASADSGQLTSTLQLRLDLWQRATMIIQDYPMTGLGMNIFRSELTRLYPWYGMDRSTDFPHAHNELFAVGLDLGLPGLIAFLSLYLVAFWMLIRLWRKPRLDTSTIYISPHFLNQSIASTSLEKTVLLGFGAGLLSHLLYGMTDAVALGAKPGVLFWILLALIAGYYQKRGKIT